jgi:hypothetical protein
MPRRRGRGGQPLTGNSEEENQEVSMGETQESEEALLAERVFDTLQNNQGILQHHLGEMQDHLSKGQADLKISLMEFSKGQDRMISLLEEQARTQRIVCQYLMEQKHGKDAPTFGGNNGASGSQGGNGNQEESIHMGHTGNIPSHPR